MEARITLYQFESPDIKVSIEAYFQGEDLIIDGYDIGKNVKEYWGDSDYEYNTTIRTNEVTKLFVVMEIPVGDKNSLLGALQQRFHTNSCYSELRNFLDQQKIRYESFSWS